LNDERVRGSSPWEVQGGDVSRRRIGQAREFVTTRQGLRYQANLAATLLMRPRTEAFAGQSVSSREG
jgi:hypothetical protein